VANLENKSIRRFDTPHWIIHLDFIEDVLNLTMGEGGLISVDLSNPAPPLLTDRLDSELPWQ